jgi:hypothetical protein
MNFKQTTCFSAALAAFGLIGCLNDQERQSAPVSLPDGIIATTTSADYSEGNLGAYSIADSTVWPNLLSIFNDNSVRTYKGAAYILERSAMSNIIKIDSSAINHVVKQVHIGNAVNPHDIAFISNTKAYITCYDADQIVIYNPATGALAGKSIDLSDRKSEGGTHPCMDAAAVFEGHAYIGLGKLKSDYSQPSSSSIAVIDGLTDSVEKEIPLIKTNPQGMYLHGSVLYVACTGAYTNADNSIVLDGDLEAVDLSGSQVPETIIDETSLNGNVFDVLVIGDTIGYVLIADANFANSMVAFNPRTKTITGPVADAGTASAMECDGHYVYVADRCLSNPGIVIIDPSNNHKVGEAINVGLPPNKLALMR